MVAAHDGRIGLIPHSIGATALDVDHGDPSRTTDTVDPIPDRRDATVALTSTMATIRRETKSEVANWAIARARFAGRMAT